MRLRDFFPRLEAAMRSADAQIADHDGSKFGRGLASEGWHGGYAEALRDVDAMLRHGSPSDRPGYWRQPEKR